MDGLLALVLASAAEEALHAERTLSQVNSDLMRTQAENSKEDASQTRNGRLQSGTQQAAHTAGELGLSKNTVLEIIHWQR